MSYSQIVLDSTSPSEELSVQNEMVSHFYHQTFWSSLLRLYHKKCLKIAGYEKPSAILYGEYINF